MYTNLVRSCICVLGKNTSKVIVHPARKNFHNLKGSSWCRRHTRVGYVVFKRNLNINVLHNDARFLTDEESKEILNNLSNDPESEKELKMLEMQIELLRNDGEKVPERFKPRHTLELLKLHSFSQRRKHLSFLWLNEKKSETQIMRKRKLKEEKIKQLSEEDETHLKYGLGKNSMFLRIYQQTIHHYFNYKLLECILFEPNIVFDLEYHKHMTNRENLNCAKQLTYAFALNRQHAKPLNIFFCNADKSSMLMSYLYRCMPKMYEDDFPVHITPKSYLDIFDKDKLVYLTPHCRNELSDYDPNVTYIIGAMVDTRNHLPLSFAKAKKEGIAMAKLPLGKHLKWGPGSGKSLTINQVMNILLDLRQTNNWESALQHVPVRKLVERVEDTTFTNNSKQKRVFNSKYQEENVV